MDVHNLPTFDQVAAVFSLEDNLIIYKINGIEMRKHNKLSLSNTFEGKKKEKIS